MSENKNMIEGLRPAIECAEVGRVYQCTTEELGYKLAEELVTRFKLVECDNIILTPKLAKNQTGAYDIYAKAYFTQQPNGNVYKKGSGNGNRRNNDGRIDMVGTSGTGGGTGAFGVSDQFRQIMGPLCKVNDNGKPIMNLRTVQGFPNAAELELDFYALMCLALGIKPEDCYNFAILQVTPINTTNNFNLLYMKLISANGYRKGNNSKINYARIAQNEFRKYNSNGNQNNGGGRSYN